MYEETSIISSISSRINLVRKKLNYTLKQMAKLTGYSFSFLLAVKEGHAASFEFYDRFCRATGTRMEWLLDGTGAMGSLIRGFDYAGISGRLKELRAERQLSQLQLSKLSGVSQPTISRIEKITLDGSGKGIITERQLQKLADACSVDYDWIVFGDENAKEIPCNDEMVTFLKRHPEIRRQIYRQMQEELLCQVEE